MASEHAHGQSSREQLLMGAPGKADGEGLSNHLSSHQKETEIGARTYEAAGDLAVYYSRGRL